MPKKTAPDHLRGQLPGGNPELIGVKTQLECTLSFILKQII